MSEKTGRSWFRTPYGDVLVPTDAPKYVTDGLHVHGNAGLSANWQWKEVRDYLRYMQGIAKQNFEFGVPVEDCAVPWSVWSTRKVAPPDGDIDGQLAKLDKDAEPKPYGDGWQER